jgi:hypothetical protein
MDARTNGQPLWFVRPIIDGVIREDLTTPFAGTLDAMVEHIADLHRETGLQHAARTGT